MSSSIPRKDFSLRVHQQDKETLKARIENYVFNVLPEAPFERKQSFTKVFDDLFELGETGVPLEGAKGVHAPTTNQMSRLPPILSVKPPSSKRDQYRAAYQEDGVQVYVPILMHYSGYVMTDVEFLELIQSLFYEDSLHNKKISREIAIPYAYQPSALNRFVSTNWDALRTEALGYQSPLNPNNKDTINHRYNMMNQMIPS